MANMDIEYIKKSVDSCHRQDVAIECDNVLAVDAEEMSAKNVGKSQKLSSVAGCNLNNDNAGRTLNANNSVRNGNDNYAGGFAHNLPPFMEETLATCPPRANIKDNEARLCEKSVSWQRDYKDGNISLESGAKNSISGVSFSTWEALHHANSRRKLKGLRKFYLNKELVLFAIKRTCRLRNTKNKERYLERASSIADKIIAEIRDDKYHVRGYDSVTIPRAHKSNKDRNAKIFTLYDRCVQTLVLTIIEEKLRNKVLRNNYSNIAGRGIFSNDKRYCMVNKIRRASKVYKGYWYLTTDIRKFYESTKSDVILEVLFRTIKDNTTRKLLKMFFDASGDLPIGCCLSPIIADVLMNDYDMTILKNFKPRFYAAFGDNRLYIGGKKMLQDIRSFTKKYYERHYHFHMKKDYVLGKVSDGFKFCKTNYYQGFVRCRSELKRRAIKCAHVQQSFCGYQGILQKTDSKHLLNLIMLDLNNLKQKNIQS